MGRREFRGHLKHQLRIRTVTLPELDRRVHREFPDWFECRIQHDLREHTPDFKALANGPIDRVRRFTAFNVNGFKFCTVARDEGLKTQNSGVFGSFGTRSYSSSSDTNMQYGGIAYYGKLIDVIELNYQGRFTVTLFKCLWANTTTTPGITTDELGITSINFSKPIYTSDLPDDEQYILASEAHQVYYVENERNKDWHMVVHLKPRDLFGMGDNDDITHDSESLRPFPLDNFFPDGDGHLPIVRPSEDE